MNEEKLMKYFLEAKNIGKLDNCTTVGIGGDPGCTDYIKLYLVIDNNDIIIDAKAEVFGCHVAIAATSAFTELIMNKNIKRALDIKPNDVLEKLGGLPEEKVHCTALGPLALENAINDYLLDKIMNMSQENE